MAPLLVEDSSATAPTLGTTTAPNPPSREISVDSPSQTSANELVPFFTLPLELRLKIYEHVHPRLEIWHHYQSGGIGDWDRFSAPIVKWTPDPTLRVCRQMRAELLVSTRVPRITICGTSRRLLLGDQDLLQEHAFNIDTLKIQAHSFACLFQPDLYEGRNLKYHFFKPDQCPNLKYVEVTLAQSRCACGLNLNGGGYGRKQIANNEFPASPLPAILYWLKRHGKSKISGLLRLFPARDTSVLQTNRLIKECKLVVTTAYEVRLRGTESRRPYSGRSVLFEERFKLVCD